MRRGDAGGEVADKELSFTGCNWYVLGSPGTATKWCVRK